MFIGTAGTDLVTTAPVGAFTKLDVRDIDVYVRDIRVYVRDVGAGLERTERNE